MIIENQIMAPRIRSKQTGLEIEARSAAYKWRHEISEIFICSRR